MEKTSAAINESVRGLIAGDSPTIEQFGRVLLSSYKVGYSSCVVLYWTSFLYSDKAAKHAFE